MTQYVTELGKQRLLRLADRLDKVANEHFNISHWYDAMDRHRYDQEVGKYLPPIMRGEFAKTKRLRGKVGGLKRNACDPAFYVSELEKTVEVEVVLDEGFCGSTACVLGHAALIKEFNEQGLYVAVGVSGSQRGKGDVVYEKNGVIVDGWNAGAEFFELHPDHANALFYGMNRQAARSLYKEGSDDSCGKITPQEAAAGLRKYVETNGEALQKYMK